MKTPEMIRLDKTSFDTVIRKILGLKNLKCYLCKRRITKNNFGYINKSASSCNEIICLIGVFDRIEELNRKGE